MTYIDPKWILVDFLRHRTTDPRARAEASNSNSFTATAGQTDFSLTATTGTKVACITDVQVDSVSKDKWVDYRIDFELQKIIFFTGLTIGQEVDVTFKEGSTNWIYDDKPQERLNNSAFPRINIKVLSGPGNRLGQYNAPIEGVLRIQVDVWTKPSSTSQIFTIDSHKYAGEKLANYLAYQVKNAFANNESDLFPALYGFDGLGEPKDLPFNDELQCHHKVIEFDIRGINLGNV